MPRWMDADFQSHLLADVPATREQTPDGKTSDERGGVPPTNKTIPAKPVDTGGVEGLAEEIDCRVEELFTNDATVEVFVDGGRVVIGTRESGDRFRELGSGSTFLHALGKSTTPITRNIAANHATEKPTDSMGGETDKDYASPDGSDASEAVSENAGARVADTEAAIQAMRDLSGPLGRARLELGDHESSGAMLEAFSRLRYALTGFSQDAPIRGWCECQGVDGTLHKHYHKPPYGCARCSKCKAFQADNNTLDLAMREQTAQAIDHDARARNRQATATEKNNALLAKLLSRMDTFESRLSAVEPATPDKSGGSE